MTMAELIHTPPPPRVAREEATTELIAAMREIIRYAIMTLAALRDPDARFLGMARSNVQVVRDVSEAYGYGAANIRPFQPSPKNIGEMEIVMPWLAWLRRTEGKGALDRLVAWSMGVPLWQMAQQEECTQRTIHNRIDRSVSAVVREFASVDIRVERIEEEANGTVSFVVEKPPGPHGGEVKIKKVYVGGTGYVRGGKHLRNGQENLGRRFTT